MVSRYLALLASVALLAACEAGSNDDGSAGGTSGSTGYEHGRGDDMMQTLAPNVGDRVFFAYDSSVVTSEGQATLQRQADWLKSNAGVKVAIEGHCDERGTREYNLALGELAITS
jgi:peptidoglycan-associated lipoprotein